MLQLPKIVDVMKAFGNGELDPIILKTVKVSKVYSTSLLIVFLFTSM